MAGAAVAAGAFAVAGTVTQGISSYNASRASAKVRAQQATNASQVAGANARDFKRSSDFEAARDRARAGARGIDFSRGSPLAASEDFASEAELNRLRILHGGEVQSSRFMQQGALDKAQGRSALLGAGFRAGSLLFSGASGFGGNDTIDTTPQWNNSKTF